MTNKTINGVPRDLISRAINYIGRGPKGAEDAIEELRALLAAPDPIVEADGIGEPVGYCGLNALDGLRRNGRYLMMVEKPERYLDMPLYSADQVAALQSTIAQLRNDLDGTRLLAAVQLLRIDQNAATIAQLKAENERLLCGAPAGYVPCSPSLLESGVDCATALRWSSASCDRHSHWHPAPVAVKLSELVSCAEELADLVESGEVLDSFTTQPVRNALAALGRDRNADWEETFGPDYTGDAGISASVKLPARNDASKNLDLEQCGYVDGWNACLDEVRRMNP